jgi:prepilin-type N-terminal cleavage/methylation domain-containing protein/prepilin-type processing-associated H-X9-DG protein
MAAKPHPLPSAQEVADTLEMPLDEAEQLLERVLARQQRTDFKWPAFTLIELLVTVAVLGLLAGILWPNPCINREPAPKAQCLSNAKQITNALLLYASDYDDRLPPAPIWQDVLFDYHKCPAILACPTRKTKIPGFSYNALLHCRPLSDIHLPEEQALVFESDMGRRNASDPCVTFVTPHNKRGHLGYVDGHVKAVPVLPAADAGLKSKRLNGNAN